MSENREPLDLDELRRVAESATPGEWHVVLSDYDYADPVIETEVAHNPGEVNGYGVSEKSRYVAQTSYDGLSHTTYNSHADAAHIAAMDPPTTLALLAEVFALREQVARVREVAQEWRDMEPWPNSSSDGVMTYHRFGRATLAALAAAPKEPRP